MPGDKWHVDITLLAVAPSSFLLISSLTIVLQATVFYSCRVQVLLLELLRSQRKWEREERSGSLAQVAETGRRSPQLGLEG